MCGFPTKRTKSSTASLSLFPKGASLLWWGESGSGKSTLAKLLVHFYDVTDGRITLGGQDLREMSLGLSE